MNHLIYAYYAFAAFYAVLLPSYIMGKTLYPGERLAVRLGLGLVLSITVVPTLCFAVAMLFGTSMSEVVLFSVASAIMVAGLSVQTFRLKQKSRKLEE